jgi:hypothetical protein
MQRAQKITVGEMRSSGVTGVVVFCSNHKCGHNVTMSAEQWPDEIRLSDIEQQFICKVCGHRGAEIRPNFPPG